MTRSSSPTGAVEFSYDFPVASTSALSASYRTRPSSPRRPSPVRPHWEYVDEDRDHEEEEEYASYGYPSRRRGVTVPIPTATGNQWRSQSPLPFYPYSSAAVYPQYPYATPSSYESESSCSSASHQQHKKIRKAHPTSIRSTGSSSSPPTSCPFTSSSTSSSPESTPYDLEDDFEPELEEQEERGRTVSKDSCKPHLDLRRQWAALSLRVQFGVFRAKRSLRSRVMSV
ncbi:hypothetical protein DFH07DRAFT_848705 [Mycena maculata]|uniref:Uncharacterized protein n=1 Tax=Mycena maculata TaxID=230809 RepID=A0AAD7MTW6_9AGAR|nr:hypothetical protein DFH07DRAFT_848705 [Mycena maculata]